MKAYDLYKSDQTNIPLGNDFKTAIPKRENNMKSVNKNSDPNPIPNTPKNGGKPFPWKTICVIVSAVIITYLILKTPRKKITKEEVDSHHQV